MTISSSSNKVQFNGNGATFDFPFTFKVFDEGDLEITLLDALGVETLQVITTNYTVALNPDQNNNPGGTATMVVAPATGEKLTILRVIDALQETDITNGGGFYPEVMENALDRVTMLSQQNQEEVDRAMQLPVSSTGVSADMPVPEAGRGLKWNATATGLENSAADLDDIASNAAASAAASASSAASSLLYSTNSAGSATAAANSAVSAQAQAALSAASAASSGSFTAQNLAAIDQTVMASTTFVAAIIYDTSKDSDGGAWRKRCSHTSWENETLSGNWLGSAANETAARLIAGATTGSYYYDTTAALFKMLSAGSGTTTVYRGNARQFPAKVLITLETVANTSGRVIIWDLTQAGCPMWLTRTLATTVTLTSLAAFNGYLAVASNGTTGYLWCWNFVANKRERRYQSGLGFQLAEWGDASTALLGFKETGGSAPIVNSYVNSVAITALPDAPIDVATGLPTPTIAVGTDGGWSQITHSGTVYDFVFSTYPNVSNIGFLPNAQGVWWTGKNNGASNENAYHEHPLLTADLTGQLYASFAGMLSFGGLATTYPAIPWAGIGIKAAWRGDSAAYGNPGGVAYLDYGTRISSVANTGMVAGITYTYPSGWMPGDIRLAALADTTAETLTASGELVTNGDFTSDLSGWTDTSAAGGAIAWNATGKMDLINTTGNASFNQSFSTVVGKTYAFTVTKDGTTSTINVGTSSGGVQLYAGSSAANDINAVFVATTATAHISGIRTTAGTATVDNISVKLAAADRSVKANGLTVNGSITKAAVASGAQLVGYSGWSAANYLERAYDADFDFGTGTIFGCGWLKQAANSAIETHLERDSAVSAQRFTFATDAAGMLVWTCDDNSTTRAATGTVAIDDGVWRFVSFSYSAGTLTIKVNAEAYATATGAALLTLNNATAVLDVGKDVASSYPATNATLALWRLSATIPSDSQLRQMYETEKAMFEANAQCCLAGTSNAILALGYDEDTDLLHAMTSYGRSTFKGLVRVASEATAVGTPRAVAGSAGAIAQLGSTTSDIYVPAYNLREELDMARNAGKVADIEGGTIDGAVIGASVPVAGTFTTVTGTQVTSSGAVLSYSPTLGIGYSAGAGGTVTQGTSKSTGVTLNKVTGQITMHNASLSDATTVSFTLTNSAIATTDCVLVNHDSAGTLGAYILQANNIGAGSCQISVRNVSGGPLGEAIVINFVVVKGVAA
jgi:trimeric autotransporter adhesin